MHIINAHNEGMLSEVVTFRLLEAHLAQGGIPDPSTAERLSPEEALHRKYITKEMAEKLIVALQVCLNCYLACYIISRS